MEEKCLSINHSSSFADNDHIAHNFKNCLAKNSSTLSNLNSQMSSSSLSSLSSSSKEDFGHGNDYDEPIQDEIESIPPCDGGDDATKETRLLKDDIDCSEPLSNDDTIDLIGLQKTITRNCNNGSDYIESNNSENTPSATTTTTEVLISDRETIFLETPVIDEQPPHYIGLINNDFQKTNAVAPKRLSGEFILTDDSDDVISRKNVILNTKVQKENQVEYQNASKDAVTASCSSLSASSMMSDECENNINESGLIERSSKSVVVSISPPSENLMVIDQLDNVEKHKQQHEMSLRLKQMNINNYTANSGVFATKQDASVNSDQIAPPLSADDIQSMDLIERRDFENEKRLTGGIIIKSCSITSNDKINLNTIKSCLQQQPTRDSFISNYSEVLEFERNCAYREHLSTPTSSRASNSRSTKSTAKINLSSSLSHFHHHHHHHHHHHNNINNNNNNNNNSNNNHHQHQSKSKSLNASTSLYHKKGQLESNLSTASAAEALPPPPVENSSILKRESTAGDIEISADNEITCHQEEEEEEDEQQQRKKQHQKQQTNSNDVSPAAVAAAELLFSNPNSNDSLTSDRSYTTSSNFASSQGLQEKPQQDGCSRTNVLKSSNENDSKSTSKFLTDRCQQLDDMASTSSARCLYATTFKYIRNAYDKVSSEDNHSIGAISVGSNTKSAETNSTTSTLDRSSNGSVSGQLRSTDGQKYYQNSSSSTALLNDANPAPESSITDHLNHINENDFDDETWPDCEGNSDEEVCTCHHSSSCSDSSSSIDNSFGSRCVGIEEDVSSSMVIYNRQQQTATSKDAELSSYIQMVSISEDDASVSIIDNMENLGDVSATLDLISSQQQQQRKRKYNDCLLSDVDNNNTLGEAQTSCGRKRIAYDFTSTPRNGNQSLTGPNSSPTVGRRTPRSIIPTRDNPPPELQDWLVQFQRWSHAERLLALDRLIEYCEPTQVRHMMKVIEPQFQRDFISLLPRELALQVLAYLEPKDLLRAAQTCRSWRFLCDDNLLWKEKCRRAQILTEPRSDRPKRGRAGNMPPITSPWKAAYMRQHIIEMNWRSRPIRDPKVLKGHDDHVITCLQFSGNRIVSGSDDNTLKVWSAVTGRCLRTLVGHTGGVWSSQMSGNIIISGSTDRTLKVWDMESGQCVHTLLGHTSTVRCMHLHGKKVVSGSRDATLRVWDIEQGSCLHVLVGHLAAVRCVQYDGKLIVSGAYDYMVKIWHPERQECLHTLQGHTNRVYSLQFDGIHVVSGSLDTSIRVWDAETGNCKHTLMGHQSLTSGMELRQNILVSGNADSTVKVWDITSGQCLQTLSGPNKHQSAVTCLQFNSRFVVTSSDDGTVKLWDVKTGEFIRNLVALDSGGSGGVVWRIRANDTKLICAVGSRNGTEETKLMVLDFDVEGACVKCS